MLALLIFFLFQISYVYSDIWQDVQSPLAWNINSSNDETELFVWGHSHNQHLFIGVLLRHMELIFFAIQTWLLAMNSLVAVWC